MSHTWVQKLMREFARNPATMLREERVHGPATFEGLRRAKEETRRQREHGWLRGARRWRVAEFRDGDDVVRIRVPTKASQAAGNAKPHYAPDNEESEWERETARESRVNEYGKSLARRRRGRWYPGMTGGPH